VYTGRSPVANGVMMTAFGAGAREMAHSLVRAPKSRAGEPSC
jgi:hypothetical protein